jgi:hypothetical protein
VRTSRVNHKSIREHFGVLRVKHQKASLDRRPSACTCKKGAWFSPNTIHVIQKWTVNATDGSSCKPGVLLEISYFTGVLQYLIFYNIIFGLGKMTISQDLFPAMQRQSDETKEALFFGIKTEA